MRRRWIVLVALAGCGRLSFEGHPHADAGAGAPDAPQDGIAVVADLTSLVPYNANDFMDGTSVDDNHPGSVAALTPPFAMGFAIAAGRSVIEVHLDGDGIVHVYRPPAADTGGPDHLSRLAQGADPDGQPRLWGAATSLDSGDGLYDFDPATWSAERVISTNNVTDVVYDAAGGFDGLGTPRLYVISGNMGIVRHDDATQTAQIHFFPNDTGSLALAPDALYAIDSQGDGLPERLWRIDPGTHATTQLDQADDLVLAEGPVPAGEGPIAIRNARELVRYTPDGSVTVIATPSDPDVRWTAACVPGPTHDLAGRIVVLAFDTVTFEEQLLLLPE